MQKKQAAAKLFNDALLHQRAGRFNDAEQGYKKGLLLDNSQADVFFLLGQVYFAMGKYALGEENFQKAISMAPLAARYQYGLGIELFNIGEPLKSLPAFEKADQIEPNNFFYWQALAMNYEQIGQIQQAISFWEKLRTHPEFGEEAFQHLYQIHNPENNKEATSRIFNEWIKYFPKSINAYSSRADFCEKNGEIEQALSDRKQCVLLLPQDGVMRGKLALVLMHSGEEKEALFQFDESVKLSPENGELHFNRGIAYNKAGKNKIAYEALEKACSLINEPSAKAIVITSLANVLTELKENEKAIALYIQAIQLNSDFAPTHFNLGMLYLEANQRLDAASCFEKALVLDPDNGLITAHLAFQRMHLCQWEKLEKLEKNLTEIIESNRADIPPFIVLSLPNTTPKLQYQCAQNHSLRLQTSHLRKRETSHQHDRIRVGYFSSDFKNHATSYLMIEMLEAHDRKKFEIYALSYGINDHSEMRTRVEKSVEHFIDLSETTEPEAIECIKALDLDILIDLKGYTEGNKSHLLQHGLAPIQINWLGYPGTLAAPWVDYLIADEHVAPECNQWMYSEKLLHLPGSYQPVAKHRESIGTPTRQQEHLPEDALVLCSFNQTYKITPEIFQCWLRALQKTPNVVLWLWASNPWAEQELRKHAEKKNIEASRIIFAEGKKQPEHLARLSLADLALDTYPCNGHTTTSDALWAGVPTITLQGETFASRVASSLLAATNLSELITTSIEDYEAKILKYCTDKEWRDNILQKSKCLREKSDFFNAKTFCTKLERLLTDVFENHSKNHIDSSN